MATNQYYHQLDQQNYLQSFKRAPIVLERGQNATVWDVEGKAYIDVLAGIAVNNVGHCHPKVVKAIQQQAEQLIHISNIYLSKPQAELSKKLKEISGLDRVFFANSGAEAVEGAMKLARKWAHKNGRGGEILSMEGSFHGRTLATIATGKAAMQKGFAPIPEGFHKAVFNDLKSVEDQLRQNKALGAIIVEPIQGEGGINPATKIFLQGLRALCDFYGVVLIFDEIQCGMGRTGYWFAKDYYGVQPDIMTSAKGLGGGVPIGAFLANEKTAQAIEPGDHGTTFGGNPLVCAASLATIQAIEEEQLLQAAQQKGAWFTEHIEALNMPSLKQIRGLGLMIGLVFDFETKPLVAKMLEKGLLANATAGNVVRIVPPLTIGYDELKRVVQVIAECVHEHTEVPA